jgi:hypothetical protein
LKRHEILRDVTAFGVLWGTGFGADFAGAPQPIKYLIAGLWTFAVVIGGTAYFGWDRLYARRSFVKVSVLGAVAIGIMIYTGYLMDNLSLNTWQWLEISGILVVTWANLFGLLLVFMSALMYYWSFKVGSIIASEWEQIHQEDAEKKVLKDLREILERTLQKGNQASHS